MKRVSFFLISLLLLCISSNATQLEPSQIKRQADSLYATSDFKQAATLYEKILEKGEDAYVYYNLGNCYYRLNDMAHAMLNYERAASREPGDSDIRFNLALARSKTIDKIETNDGFFLTYWFRSLVNSMNTDQWGRLSIITFILFLICLIVFLFGKKLLLRKIGFGVAIASIMCVVLFNIFAYVQRKQYLDHTHAIVMQPCTIRSTPAESGNALFELHEGTKVKIIDNSMKNWVEIRLGDGKTGWMPSQKMELI